MQRQSTCSPHNSKPISDDVKEVALSRSACSLILAQVDLDATDCESTSGSDCEPDEPQQGLGSQRTNCQVRCNDLCPLKRLRTVPLVSCPSRPPSPADPEAKKARFAAATKDSDDESADGCCSTQSTERVEEPEREIPGVNCHHTAAGP